jgi:hypothetical protein
MRRFGRGGDHGRRHIGNPIDDSCDNGQEREGEKYTVECVLPVFS